jgi:hypothetical protein
MFSGQNYRGGSDAQGKPGKRRYPRSAFWLPRPVWSPVDATHSTPMFDGLVTGQVMPTNPAHSVRGPRRSVTKGVTPVLSSEESNRAAHWHGCFNGCRPARPRHHCRDDAHIRSRRAVVALTVEDYFPQKKRGIFQSSDDPEMSNRFQYKVILKRIRMWRLRSGRLPFCCFVFDWREATAAGAFGMWKVGVVRRLSRVLWEGVKSCCWFSPLSTAPPFPQRLWSCAIPATGLPADMATLFCKPAAPLPLPRPSSSQTRYRSWRPLGDPVIPC